MVNVPTRYWIKKKKGSPLDRWTPKGKPKRNTKRDVDRGTWPVGGAGGSGPYGEEWEKEEPTQ